MNFNHIHLQICNTHTHININPLNRVPIRFPKKITNFLCTYFLIEVGDNPTRRLDFQSLPTTKPIVGINILPMKFFNNIVLTNLLLFFHN